MSSRRAGALSLAFVVAAVGLVLLLATLASRSGPHRVVQGTLHDPNFQPPLPSLTASPPPAGPRSGDGGGHHASSFIAILTVVIAFAFIALVLVVLFQVARHLLSNLELRRRPPAPADPDFDLLDDPEPLAEEIRRGAADQLDRLRSGAARNAIVECWELFETQAARVGLPRLVWEASSEFTTRLLGLVAADPDAVQRLEALYREARFSDHEVGEDRRSAALGALERIHSSIRTGVRP